MLSRGRYSNYTGHYNIIAIPTDPEVKDKAELEVANAGSLAGFEASKFNVLAGRKSFRRQMFLETARHRRSGSGPSNKQGRQLTSPRAYLSAVANRRL